MSQNRNIAYKNLKTTKQTPSFSFQKPIISHVYYTFVFFGIIPIDKPIQIFQRSLSQVVDTYVYTYVCLGFCIPHTYTYLTQHVSFLLLSTPNQKCYISKFYILRSCTCTLYQTQIHTSSFTYFFLENILLFGTTN
jgi:hypothetical protein